MLARPLSQGKGSRPMHTMLVASNVMRVGSRKRRNLSSNVLVGDGQHYHVVGRFCTVAKKELKGRGMIGSSPSGLGIAM